MEHLPQTCDLFDQTGQECVDMKINEVWYVPLFRTWNAFHMGSLRKTRRRVHTNTNNAITLLYSNYDANFMKQLQTRSRIHDWNRFLGIAP